ncbi:TonB-dependent siderophore receptor, partial [Pseudomonas syringae pv. tagetis]
ELTNTVKGAFDVNRAQASPKYNVNLGAEGVVPRVKGLTLTCRGIYSGWMYLDQANSKIIDSSERFDVGERYEFKVDQKDIT